VKLMEKMKILEDEEPEDGGEELEEARMLHEYAAHVAISFGLSREEFVTMMREIRKVFSGYKEKHGITTAAISKKASRIKSVKIRSAMLFHLGFTFGALGVAPFMTAGKGVNVSAYR